MVPEPGDRILLWSLSVTDAYTLESCGWFHPDSFGSLHVSVSEFVRAQLDTFYAGHSEYFNLAEYPDLVEQLLPSEMPIFRAAAGVPEDANLGSIADFDTFRGLRHVIPRRLECSSLEELELAADLFNWTIDSGLFLSGTDSRGAIRVGPICQVAPFVLHRILSRLPCGAKPSDGTFPVLQSDFERRFFPLAPVLIMLNEAVESENWTQNELAPKLFCWIVDSYELCLEREA
jgi:hypothetical protein